MAQTQDPEVLEPKRIQQFARFFKNYMGISTFVVAALPIPVNLTHLIPLYQPDAGSISVITSVVCFLILSFIFYNRHRTAKIFFLEIEASEAAVASPRTRGSRHGSLLRNPLEARRRMLSLLIFLLILTSTILFFVYQLIWMRNEPYLSGTQTLKASLDMEMTQLELMICYVGFFAFAEAAFVLMASKEYLQDLLGLSDNQLIRGLESPRPATKSREEAPAEPTSRPIALPD